MNTQFAIQASEDGSDDIVYLLEVNPRASRTVPFVSKATGMPLAKIAARCMAGKTLAGQGATKEIVPDYYSVKEAIFPFAKFQGVDPILGPEMRSTGEVMGVGRSFGAAMARAQEAGGIKAPPVGKVFISVRDPDKKRVLPVAQDLVGTRLLHRRVPPAPAAWLREHGIDLQQHQQGAGRPPARGGPDQERRNRVYRQHHGRTPGHRRLLLDPARGPAAPRHLFNHRCRRQGAGAFAGIPRHGPGAGIAGTAQGASRVRAPLTMQGAQRLRQELDLLKTVKRPEVITAIAEARAHGDLKENAEYHAAREQQGFIEGRIKQLESELSHSEIIDVSKLNAGSRIVFGAKVVLADVDTDEEKRYQIVGDLEADIKLGLIAISSPLARALIGKHEGDSVTIDAPAGQREYEIVSVSYAD